ncbi:hypothetical protein NX722_19265 [Endozoicomonas gorgoniicola]|uniref:Uncharacterized protein n=1 Tax=Endozoicomonas gorgoniicola TaxID=1234144 RepID=A0ABT3MZB7_9GAMM|nr:hypothetical protein [Endozoicomonas gorgoniicola]MCW7554716.1 hypothetical protein [Endozoicomonas gorgoniicola]
MDCGPVQTLIQIISGSDRCTTPAPETASAKAQKSFEEASFFAAHFKDFTVRPMPDPALMQVLRRGQWRRKLRKVSKKEQPERTHMRKPGDKEEEKEAHHEELHEKW